MSIAFFDSGIGGLTVLHEARQRMPGENYLYFADTLHVPYGTKTKEQVRAYMLASVQAIMEDDPVKALVVACNTATSIAIHELRSIYSFPIIGMEPAVKPAVEMNRRSGRRVLVTATPLTLRESKYHELVKRIDDQAIVDSLPLPELVEYCERLMFDGPEIEAYFRQKFSGLRLEEYGTIVLGCTHFPFFRKALSRIVPPHVNIIDGSSGTVRRLQEMLENGGERADAPLGNVKFISSDASEDYVSKMKTALQRYSEMQP